MSLSQAAPLRLGLPDLQRLRAAPPIRLGALMEIPIDLHLHARLDRRRRGRPDAPADRAAGLAARDARADRAAARRRQRGRRGVAGDHAAASTSPSVLVPDAAGAADARPHEVRLRRAALRQGAYVLADGRGGKPDVLLLGTGSEVALCVAAYEQLTAEGIAARVVSMPSWELFERQAEDVPRAGAAAGRSRRASRSSRRRPSAGTATSASTGHDDRHAHLRRVGAAQGPPEEVRLHAGGRGGRRARAAVRVAAGVGPPSATRQALATS